MARTIQATTPSKAPTKTPRTGRPSPYTPAMNGLAERVVGTTGATGVQLAKVLEIDSSTLKRWMLAHTDFRAAIKRGRDLYDCGNIEVSMRQRANGYEYDEVTVEDIQLKQGSGADTFYVPATKTRTTKKMMAPDVGAGVFWLCNRNPDRWQNTQKQVIEGKVKHTHDVSTVMKLAGMGQDQLEKLRALADESGGVIDVDGKELKVVSGGRKSA
jgi:hypothetical protein